MKISVVINDRIIFYGDIESSTTVKALKEKLVNKSEISVDNQILYYYGTYLNNNDKSLDYYNVRGGNTILLSNKYFKANIRIFSKHYVIDSLTENTPVIDIKKKIFDIDGIPVEMLKLVWAGKELDNNLLLKDYNIDREGNYIGVLCYSNKNKDKDNIKNNINNNNNNINNINNINNTI